MKRKEKINSEKFINLAYIVLLLSIMIGSLKVVLNNFI